MRRWVGIESLDAECRADRKGCKKTIGLHLCVLPKGHEHEHHSHGGPGWRVGAVWNKKWVCVDEDLKEAWDPILEALASNGMKADFVEGVRATMLAVGWNATQIENLLKKAKKRRNQ